MAHYHAAGTRHVHSRKSTQGGHKAPPDRQYFGGVAQALDRIFTPNA